MNIPDTIFRAYDIRGITDSEITIETAELIGQALGNIAKRQGQKQFCVGYDGRHSSPTLAQGLHKGLMVSGIDVIDIGVVATPLLYFASVHYHTGCGVMITGSHNPAEYNGFKMMVAGKTLALEEITEIYQLIIGGNLPVANSLEQGKLQQLDVSPAYLEALLSQHTADRKMRVVIDAGNGATAEIAPRLFKALGYDVVALFCQIDGDFPNHHPDPGKPENMRDLQAAVIEHRADIGIAFDGDGDRLGIVTEQGKMIFPDKAMMLFAEDMLARHPGAQVIVDVKSSPLLVQHIENSGGRALIWKTGHSLIKRKMKETGALLAGEMSGHIFFAEHWYGFDDALLAAARLLGILARKGQPASQIFDSYVSWQGTPEINITTTDSKKFAIVQKLIDEGDFGDAKKLLIDGIRVEYERCWGLMRCSNTTPALVFRFEGQDDCDLKGVIDIFSRELDRLVPELDQSVLLGYTFE